LRAHPAQRETENRQARKKVTEITKFFNIQIGNKENIEFDEKRLRNERDLILNAINNDKDLKKN